MYIGHVHGTRKYAKADTVEVGKRIIKTIIDLNNKVYVRYRRN